MPNRLEYRNWGAEPGVEIIDTLAKYFDVDYYVGWLAAAEIHGAAHQAPQVFQVAVSRHIRDRVVGRTRFQFHTRVRAGNLPTIQHPSYRGFARVSSPELTMLDVASDVELAGGIDNVATVIVELSEVTGFSMDALLALREQFPASAFRRVGWVLEKFGESALAGDLELLRLASTEGVSAARVDPSRPVLGAFDARWNLRINHEVEPDL